MQSENRFDDLIRNLTAALFPGCDWLLIKSQVCQESSFNLVAESPCGALGLLQVMPETGKEYGYTPDDLFLPVKGLTAGIKYLYAQYIHFPEIPDPIERLKFALASYNAGRGYINKAIELAYQFEFKEPIPAGHKGAKPGFWRNWGFTANMLKSPACSVDGKTPDWKQATEYVDKIWARYLKYKA